MTAADISASVRSSQKRKTKTGPWNKGKALGQKKAFSAEEVGQITNMLNRDKRPLAVRDFALLRAGIDTLLRSSDLLRLEVGDIYRCGSIVTDFSIKQQKTGKAVVCDLMPETQAAILAWLRVRWQGEPDPSAILFPLTTRHHGNLIKAMAAMIRLDPARYGTHSVRRTKAAAVYARTKNHEVVRQLLGHQNLGWTSAYLGVDREDARAISKEVRI